MKRRWIAAAVLALLLSTGTKAQDSLRSGRDIPRTEIEVVYSHYLQDGEHSAVTGGKGTQELSVYAPKLTIGHRINARHAISLEGGADIITSASVDNIDFVVSSASLVDSRSHITLGYSYTNKENSLTLGLASGLSLESDYRSIPVLLNASYAKPGSMRDYKASLQFFDDDLRWGLFNPDLKKPTRLVYPKELRNTEWFDIYKRHTLNLKLGMTQVIDKRTLLGVFPEFTYQWGLLSTPFHRVYFNDSTLRVENLPMQRYRFPVGIRLHRYLGGNMVLKSAYGFYYDSFGILGNSLQVDLALKLNPHLNLIPFGRVYKQRGSPYFLPYGEHDPQAEFYTSDYDLADFSSWKAGLAFRWMPSRGMGRHMVFEEVQLRYAYYHRSDDLYAHMLTLSLSAARQKVYDPSVQRF